MKYYLYIGGFWCAVLLGAWIWMNNDIQQPPGVIAPDDPRQLEIGERSWDRGEAHFRAVAQFDLQARVLSTNHYQFDAEADLSPVDLALGWDGCRIPQSSTSCRSAKAGAFITGGRVGVRDAATDEGDYFAQREHAYDPG